MAKSALAYYTRRKYYNIYWQHLASRNIESANGSQAMSGCQYPPLFQSVTDSEPATKPFPNLLLNILQTGELIGLSPRIKQKFPTNSFRYADSM